jgi:hypothetical protein
MLVYSAAGVYVGGSSYFSTIDNWVIWKEGCHGIHRYKTLLTLVIEMNLKVRARSQHLWLYSRALPENVIASGDLAVMLTGMAFL